MVATSTSASAQASPIAWSIVEAPQLSQTYDLDGVTCTSGSDCWAVGGSNSETVALHWDGTSWSIVTSANTTSPVNELTGVTCVSASDCWAVGYVGSSDGTQEQTLAEHWNGTSWSIVTTPSPSAPRNFLLGISCPSSSDCWAVGQSGLSSGAQVQTLIEQWNGTSWSIVTSANTTSPLNYLNGVTCVSTSDCWAVGNSGNGTATLAEQWDGTTWSMVATPSPDPQGNQLLAVTCVSSSDCWAAGDAGIPPGGPTTLALHWDGSAWSVIMTPNSSGSEQTYLTSISCTESSNCWAVGYSVVPTGLQPPSPLSTQRTVAEQWDGTSWSLVDTPNDDPIAQNGLAGVTCVSASDCWAVGRGAAALIEHGAPPTPRSITAQPASETVDAGQAVSFTAAASAAPTPSVQWQSSADGGTTWGDITGATSNTYSITDVPVSDNGDEFRAVFTNEVGTATTNPAMLTVIVPPPTTSVLLPSSDATIVGGSWLDAAASSPVGIASVHFEVSGDEGLVSHKVISSSVVTSFGWFGGWDATDVPDGRYTLQSVATDTMGRSTTSAGIAVTVDNPPLQTAVLDPSDGATLSGSATFLDASAVGTSDVTEVQFMVTGQGLSSHVVATATQTAYGWMALWDTTSGFPNGSYTLQSVATEVGGTTATSPGITVTVQN